MDKQMCKGFFSLLGMIILILDSKTALYGASEGIKLCLRTVIPSLFPFFFLSNMLTNALSGSNTYILNTIAKLFHIPPGAGILPICSFFGGYPVGAQSIGKLYQANIISKKDAEALLAYCNNAGPAFIFGMVSRFFQEKWISWILWMIHIISAFLVSRWFSARESSTGKMPVVNVTIIEAASASAKSMIQVCTWVILFRVMISFLSRWMLWMLPNYLQVLFSGFLELTNGCVSLCSIENRSLRFIICSVLLAFGGLCVGMQTASVVHGLKLKNYFLGKTTQGLISLGLSAALVYHNWAALLFLVVFLTVLPKFVQNKGSILEIIVV